MYEEVLAFWFGKPGSPEHGQARPMWFTKSDETDAAIKARFGDVLAQALAGDLASWADSPRGTVALILVLDQFTRNVYRDTPRAFAGDPQALSLARQLVSSGGDRKLDLFQRWFAYMPFEHSEQLTDQHEAVRLFTELAEAGMPDPLEWAHKHFEVVQRFGRFPHRNEILGRPSTSEEIEFLKTPGSRF